MHTAYLGLGSNIGERELQLEQAVTFLNSEEGIKVTQVSPIYETKPVGYTEQPDFLNMCIEISTELEELDLLKVCMIVEQQLNLFRNERCEVRIIEIDLLFFDISVIHYATYVVSHYSINIIIFYL